MRIKNWKTFNEGATSASNAYSTVSIFLSRNNADSVDDAIKKYGDKLRAKLGDYSEALYTIVDGYFNMDDYAPDGEPIETFFDIIENEI